MLDSDSQYTRLRWLLTIVGLVLYVVDIGTDVGLALRHFGEKQYVWAGLTLLFVLAGLLVSQIFSFAWYRDDMKDGLTNPDGRGTVAGMSTGELVVLHIFGMGVVSRYYHLLKKGFKVVRMTPMCSTVEERREEHHSLFCVAADLSMLKLFEAFLESAPQLLLQLYILLDHCKGSVMQCKFIYGLFLLQYRLGPGGLSPLPAQIPPPYQGDALRPPHSNLPPVQTLHHHQPHPQLQPPPLTELLQHRGPRPPVAAHDNLHTPASHQLLLIQKPRAPLPGRRGSHPHLHLFQRQRTGHKSAHDHLLHFPRSHKRYGSGLAGSVEARTADWPVSAASRLFDRCRVSAGPGGPHTVLRLPASQGEVARGR
ncbi:XK-related protein 9 isoform X2 [Hippoglossus hippoglossus]|uniref:XK-related protein 9 isoform X2 n=1 Tax=Hippoglossus hippoglossus TaxID=8267 RepID=UPI00148DEDE7|nr:XK-related protein 9 isoform X2 [Hippoglossus hippoglossus]